MRPKKDIIITILEHARSKQFGELISREEVYQVAKENGFITEKEHEQIEKGLSNPLTMVKKRRVLDHIAKEIGPIHRGGNYKESSISLENYFRLLEYDELRESRIASTEAKRYSMIAITISSLALLLAPLLTWWQIKSDVQIVEPVEIESEQLIQLNTKFDTIETKLTHTLESIEAHAGIDKVQ